jgi:hypothetical protein
MGAKRRKAGDSAPKAASWPWVRIVGAPVMTVGMAFLVLKLGHRGNDCEVSILRESLPQTLNGGL